MSWNNNITMPKWNGSGSLALPKRLTVSTLNADEIYATDGHFSNLYSYNNYLDYISNIYIATNIINLDSNSLTASNGILFVNGQAVGVPSSFSTIADWSYFPAKSDVSLNNSTIKNVLGLSSLYVSTNLIDCDTIYAIGGKIDTLYGLDQINYPKARLEDLSANEIRTSSIFTDTLFSKTIINEFEISTFSVYAEQVNADVINNPVSFDGNIINANKINLTNDITCKGVSTNFISSFEITSYYGTYQSLVGRGIGAEAIYIESTLTCMGNSRISSLQTNFLSVGLISAGVIQAQEGSFSTLFTNSLNINDLYTNNIYNSNLIQTTDLSANTINTSNLVVSESAQLNNTTLLGGVLGGCDVNFDVNTSGIFGDQYLHDINNLRTLRTERIEVLGGWTGNTVLEPYYNDSIITVGEDILRPGQVIINGFNPDPLDFGIALTVRGDTQITQNLNVLGETSFEGIVNIIGDTSIEGLLGVDGELNVTGNASFEGGVEVVGLLNALGDVNVAGIFTATGATNLLGGVAVEAGIGIAGAMGLTGGNVVFGSPIDTSHTFTSYYTTDISNNLNVNGITTFNSDVYFNSNIYLSDLKINDLSANTIQASTIITSNINTFSINNNPYSPTENWSLFNAITEVNMCNYNISNVAGLSVSSLFPLSNSSTINVSADLDLGNNSIYDINIVSTNIITTSSINGVQYVPVSQWSLFSPTNSMNWSNHSITNMSNLNVITISNVGLAGYNNINWASNSAIENVNLGGNSISNGNIILASNIITNGTNSNNSYISTITVRTRFLVGSDIGNPVITAGSIYPIASNNQLGFSGAPAQSYSNIWSRNMYSSAYRGQSGNINSTINLLHHTNTSTMNTSTINTTLINGRSLFGFIQLTNSTTQTITANTPTAVVFSSYTSNMGTPIGASWDSGNNTRINFTKPGIWRVCAQIPGQKNSTSLFAPVVHLRENGSNILPNTGIATLLASNILTTFTLDYLYSNSATTNYLEVMVYNSAENMTVLYSASNALRSDVAARFEATFVY